MKIWTAVKEGIGRVTISYKRTVTDINGVSFDIPDGGRSVSIDELNDELNTRLQQIESFNAAIQDLKMDIDLATSVLSK